MSGLNKLVEQIKSSAKNAADARLQEAKLQAESVLQQAEENAKKESERIRWYGKIQINCSFAKAQGNFICKTADDRRNHSEGKKYFASHAC